MKSFRDLKFWDRTHRFVVRTYDVTRSFPREELVNLTASIRRTATAIGTALVEAFAVGAERDSTTCFQEAAARTGELEYQLLLAHDVGYLDDAIYEELNTELLELRRQIASQMTKSKALR